MKFLRREFEHFWNMLSAEWSVSWSFRKRRCDNERDFWNMESSCAEVFHHSRIAFEIRHSDIPPHAITP
jgi:hypothetical protein